MYIFVTTLFLLDFFLVHVPTVNTVCYMVCHRHE